MLIHGGYWQQGFTIDLMPPLAAALAQDGWTVWNIEYRRLGGGGGWPETFADVAAAIDHTRHLGIDTTTVIPVGHSAGGTLAAWAASRTRLTPGGRSAVPVPSAVSLGGVLALAAGERRGVGGGVIDELMDGGPDRVPANYALGDPVALARRTTDVTAIVGDHDEVVPRWQATTYVRAVRAAGGAAQVRTTAGDHSALIRGSGPAYGTLVDVLRRDPG